MNIIQATDLDFNIVKNIVHATIKSIYPRYYPKGAVDFFLNHHSDENLLKSIKSEKVLLLEVDGIIVGTGTVKENEMCRLFILPEFQGLGYGTALIKELEHIIAKEHSEIVLDSSLTGYELYIKLGYVPIKYEKIVTENEDVLCFHIMKKSIARNIDENINYNNRIFSSVSNTSNGEVSSSTIFRYHQDKNIVWAEYAGGDIVKGFLIGTSDDNGILNFNYQHLNLNNKIRTGKCASSPKIMPSGKIRLIEKWKWTNGDNSEGESIIEEIYN